MYTRFRLYDKKQKLISSVIDREKTQEPYAVDTGPQRRKICNQSEILRMQFPATVRIVIDSILVETEEENTLPLVQVCFHQNKTSPTLFFYCAEPSDEVPNE